MTFLVVATVTLAVLMFLGLAFWFDSWPGEHHAIGKSRDQIFGSTDRRQLGAR